jgi:hypothetical protein
MTGLGRRCPGTVRRRAWLSHGHDGRGRSRFSGHLTTVTVVTCRQNAHVAPAVAARA